MNYLSSLKAHPNQAFFPRRALLFFCDGETALPENLSQSYNDFIELLPGQPPYALSLLPELPDVPLRLWLSNHACYRWLIGLQFASILGQRLPLSPSCEHNIALALHEAISNSLIHGHLGISSPSITLSDVSHYYQLMHARLSEPESQTQRIGIAADWDARSVTLTVADEGSGYDFPSHRAHRMMTQATERLPHGHGLDLIHLCTEHFQVESEGRSITMVFQRERT